MAPVVWGFRLQLTLSSQPPLWSGFCREAAIMVWRGVLHGLG